jgi:hypothetical protein
MTKRKKHVFDTGEIPHLWAHRTQDEARNRQGNLYFTGDTIHSYGSHFAIARHVETKRGKAILLATKTYSVTTSGHVSAVWSAIPAGRDVFHVPDVVGHGSTTHKDNLADYVKRIDVLVVASARARSSWSKESAHNDALALTAEATLYARFFGVKLPKLPNVPALDSDELRAIKAREAIRAHEKAEQTKRERAEALVRQQELITKWRAGQYSGCLYDVPAMLRIDGDEVVTSRGARFPVSHAKRALAFVREVRKSGQAYVRNGHTVHLGPYALDRIEPNGTVKAGCHVVSWEEIEHIAPLLDSVLTPITATDSTTEVLS